MSEQGFTRSQSRPIPLPSAAAQPLFQPTAFVWRDPADIRRRQWLFGTHYIRKYVTCTIGRRGGGKTSRAIIEILSMVTGRDLMNTGAPSEKLRVWYIGEDPRDEIEMRLIAACVRHSIRPEEIEGRLFFDSIFDLPRGAVKLASAKAGGVVPNQAAVDTLKAGITDKKVDVLLLDPLKKFHAVQENANDQMDEVMTILSEIAMEKSISIEILHHTRKPSAGTAVPMTVDDGRGADAIIAGARSARIMNGMSTKEATDFGIPVVEAWRYTRIDSGKANMAPPGKAAWAYSWSEPLPCGESVGVIESWKPPEAFEGITRSDAEVAQRLAQGGAYRADAQAKEWFGHALGPLIGLDPRNKPADKAKIKTLIKTWTRNDILSVKGGQGDNRHEKLFIWPGSVVISTNQPLEYDDD
jgi:hypothetical protein